MAMGESAGSYLAVIKVEAKDLPAITFADSDKIEVGDRVLAIGNPFGIGQTVTSGMVSALGRATLGLDYEDFIQTDAAINPGNSGGALIDVQGRLVGVNTAILSRSGGSQGIGFAIPSDLARNVMEQLTKNGKVRRGQLGITVQKVTSDIASSLKLGEAKGVIVSDVQPGSAAERAGIRKGDVITSFNGVQVNDPNTLRNQVAVTPPGAEVTLTVLRDGREQQVRATLGEFTPQVEQGG